MNVIQLTLASATAIAIVKLIKMEDISPEENILLEQLADVIVKQLEKSQWWIL